jgi:hypothetical protein
MGSIWSSFDIISLIMLKVWVVSSEIDVADVRFERCDQDRPNFDFHRCHRRLRKGGNEGDLVKRVFEGECAAAKRGICEG